jgi:hypothetical protein
MGDGVANVEGAQTSPVRVEGFVVEFDKLLYRGSAGGPVETQIWRSYSQFR